MRHYDRIFVEGMALQIFNKWSDCVTDLYPDLCISPKDPDYVIKTFWGLIDECFHSLEIRSPQQMEFKYGFFLGFLNARLNQQFFMDLVNVHSDLYKTMVALSTLQKYIQSNDSISYDLKEIYENVLDTEAQVQDVSPRIHRNYYAYTNLSPAQAKDPVLISLVNLKDELIAKFLKLKSPIQFRVDEEEGIAILFQELCVKYGLIVPD